MQIPSNYSGIPEQDSLEILERCSQVVGLLRRKNIAILGGTGFIGRWLVISLIRINREFNLDLGLHVVTRNVTNAKKIVGVLDNSDVKFHELDLSTFSKPILLDADIYVHGATSSSNRTGAYDLKNVVDATRNGFQLILQDEFRMVDKKPTLIHLSSGAVYCDKYVLGPSKEIDPDTTGEQLDGYSQSKIIGEAVVKDAHQRGLVQGANPRLFAFFGPHLPLDEHFAIGNFVRDGITARRIKVKGNQLTTRSYMYTTDLIDWLIKLIINPTINPINIGSEDPINMLQLSETVARVTKSTYEVDSINVSDPTYYFPQTLETRKHLGAYKKVGLEEGLERWIKWLFDGRV